MIQTNEIKAQMKRKGIIQTELAKSLKMNPSTLSRKLSNTNGTRITVDEATRIGEALELSRKQCLDIFFADELA